MKNFSNLLKIGVLSFLIGGCCAGSGLVQRSMNENASPEIQNKIQIEKLRQITVAITEDTLGISFPTCTGIWVDKNLILTAAHCVEDKLLISYSIANEYNKDIVRTASVLKIDKKIDLALLTTYADGIDHPIAILSSDVISTGDQVHVLGHPVSYAWSYTKGYVAAIRPDVPGPGDMGKIEKILQVSAPIGLGNSGGGAFDSQGKLIGICSWISKMGPNLSFFIHRDVIEKFLKE